MITGTTGLLGILKLPCLVFYSVSFLLLPGLFSVVVALFCFVFNLCVHVCIFLAGCWFICVFVFVSVLGFLWIGKSGLVSLCFCSPMSFGFDFSNLALYCILWAHTFLTYILRIYIGLSHFFPQMKPLNWMMTVSCQTRTKSSVLSGFIWWPRFWSNPLLGQKVTIYSLRYRNRSKPLDLMLS